jgi:hypothetical protein
MTERDSRIPVPSFNGSSNVENYIFNAKAYTNQFKTLPEADKIILLRTGISGQASEVLLGYHRDIKSVKTLLLVLRKTYKKKGNAATKLYELKQETKEPVRVFATRIRRYICQMGLTDKKKINKNCLQFFQAGIRSEFVERLNATETSDFETAIRIATKLEDKPLRTIKTVEQVLNIVANQPKSDKTTEQIIEEQLAAFFNKFSNSNSQNTNSHQFQHMQSQMYPPKTTFPSIVPPTYEHKPLQQQVFAPIQ